MWNAFARQYNGTFTIGPGLYGLYFLGTLQKICHITHPRFAGLDQKNGGLCRCRFDYILDIAKQHQLQTLQLHGSESPDFCQKLKTTELEIIKAFGVGSNFDFSVLKPYESVCDYFLFDTKGELPGGNGSSFEWSLLRDYPATKPFFLSGGIGPKDQDAISSIINLNLPIYAIDINSKFEIKPGQKTLN